MNKAFSLKNLWAAVFGAAIISSNAMAAVITDRERIESSMTGVYSKNMMLEAKSQLEIPHSSDAYKKFLISDGNILCRDEYTTKYYKRLLVKHQGMKPHIIFKYGETFWNGYGYGWSKEGVGVEGANPFPGDLLPVIALLNYNVIKTIRVQFDKLVNEGVCVVVEKK